MKTSCNLKTPHHCCLSHHSSRWCQDRDKSELHLQFLNIWFIYKFRNILQLPIKILFRNLNFKKRVLLLLLSFGPYLHGKPFSSPYLSLCMCPLFWGGSLVDNIYRGLVFVSIQPVFVFWLLFHFCFHLCVTLFCFLCLLPGLFLIYLWYGSSKLCSLLSSIQFGDPQLKMKLEKFFKPEK